MKQKNSVPIIEIFSSRVSFVRFESSLTKLAYNLFLQLKKPQSAVALYLLSDAEMRALNYVTRGKNIPTNVLSFEAPHDFVLPSLPKGVRYWGEVYCAPSFIRVHKQDLHHMMIHGILHLLGYAHEQKSDRIVMERLEDILLRARQ